MMPHACVNGTSSASTVFDCVWRAPLYKNVANNQGVFRKANHKIKFILPVRNFTHRSGLKRSPARCTLVHVPSMSGFSLTLTVAPDKYRLWCRFMTGLMMCIEVVARESLDSAQLDWCQA